MNSKTIILVAALFGALLVLPGMAAAAPAGTRYYPDDYGTIFDPTFTSYPMPASVKGIQDGAWQVWYDETPSTVDQTFDGTPYFYHLQLEDYVTGHFHVAVVIVAPDDSAHVIGASEVLASGIDTVYQGTIPMPSTWTIPAGFRLGFYVQNTADAAQPVSGTPTQKAAAKEYNAHRALNVMVATDNAAEEPPTWFETGAPYSATVPTPELGTVALMGAGLGIVGFAAVRRNRKD